MICKIISAISLILIFVPLSSQIPEGSWRDELPYNQCIKVVEVGNKIYCATNNNIFTYSTNDHSIEKLSKITGLSDIGISTMEYYQNKGILLIAYNDGNIDLLSNNMITNIPDLMNKSMSGSKSANHIFFNNNYAYISYTFGVLVIDLVKDEIKDNYIIGDAGANYEVFSVAADDSFIYAATAKGIFSGAINDPFLVDYSEWHRVLDIPNPYGSYDKLCAFNGMIIANNVGVNNNSDQLYYLKNNVWTSILPGATMQKHEIRTWGNWLLITGYNYVYQLGPNLGVVNTYDYSNPYSTLVDNSGNVWFADNNLGLVLKPSNSANYTTICPTGPGSTDVWRMLFHDGSLYVTGGGANQSWTPTYNKGELFQYYNQTWTNILNTSAYDYTTIAVNPVNPGQVYIGSWLDGVFVYNNGQLTTNYTYTNSPLQTIIPGSSFVFVCGTAFDAYNNLWITNSRMSTPLLALKPDGTWKTFTLNNAIKGLEVTDITIDQSGQLWIVLPRGTGLFVFNDNGTIDNQSDDKYLKFNPVSIYGSVIYNIYCITVDNNGAVWVGTDQGPVVYSNPGQVLQGQTKGYQPAIPLNDGKGTVEPLLGGEAINCIVVDGANQKWIGTQTGGAFLVSADGTKQIYNFNIGNSPILSNNILAIAIDGTSGEVYFGTDKGIISYRSLATTGGEQFGHVYVYPDPVRDNYHGNIIITGLITNTVVKITDISGNLVYETVSQGGQAEWDGNMVNGKRVATGVYLVFLSSEDGTKTYVTKMLVIH